MHRVLPDPALNLAFSCLRGPDGIPTAPRMIVIGPKTRPHLFPFRPRHEFVAMRVKLEWAAPLLGLMPDDHCDAEHDLADVLPAARDCAAGAVGRRGRTPDEPPLERLADDRRPARRPPPGRSTAASAHALDCGACRRLDGSRWIGWRTAWASPCATFAGRCGGTPASRSRSTPGSPASCAPSPSPIGATRPAWAAIAADSGYCDQSHLVRESRAIVRARRRARCTGSAARRPKRPILAAEPACRTRRLVVRPSDEVSARVPHAAFRLARRAGGGRDPSRRRPGARPLPRDSTARVERLADGVYAIIHDDATDQWPHSNTGVVVYDDGVLVVDATYLPSRARADIALIRRAHRQAGALPGQHPLAHGSHLRERGVPRRLSGDDHRDRAVDPRVLRAEQPLLVEVLHRAGVHPAERDRRARGRAGAGPGQHGQGPLGGGEAPARGPSSASGTTSWRSWPRCGWWWRTRSSTAR